ncbi:MAG: HNH endonuclease signature motif containing protein [Methylobacter sp.]
MPNSLPKAMVRIFFSMVLLALSASAVDAKQPRSKKAKIAFQYTHPCPANENKTGPCPGYVIDHVKAIACGGEDAPSNMQWQTVAEGKAKDKWERAGCR